jgi:hypothetical protein
MVQRCNVAGTALLVLLPTLATAQAPSSAHATVPTMQAAQANGEIRLDGRLDDAAWSAATPATTFTQNDPTEGQPATERTEFRVLIGNGVIYIGARMFDSDARAIVSRLGRRDERVSSDRLTLRLDARHDHLTAFLFDVYPAGNKGDAALGSDGFQDYSWDPVWDVATSVDAEGWSAELRIPLSQLRYNRDADAWGIQVARYVQRKQEEVVLSFVPSTESQGVNRYAHLEGMRGLPAARRIELVPYTSARAQYDQTPPGNPFRDGSDYFTSFGADLRMGLGSNLTLDATINPDFGQVEVDPAVVNLSAFETTFPEQRPFFVEGADLFRFGNLNTFNNFGTPTTFFSRRIGRAPQGFIGNPNMTHADVPEQTTIAAAMKVTGKLPGGWSVAVLDAVTPKETARYIVDPEQPELRQTVEPLANYFVGRVRRESNSGNTAIGSLFTAVHRSIDDEGLANSLRSSAYLAGLDLNHSWGDRMWALDASIAGSFIQGSEAAILRAQTASARYYQRPDADNLEVDPTRTSLRGHAAQLALTKTNGNWAGNIALSDKSPGYETNDVGATFTVGRRGIATDIHYFQPRPGPIFRNWTLGFLTGNDWNYDGDHTTSYVASIQNFRFRNFWQLNTNVFHNLPSYDDQLTRGGPIAKLPWRNNINANLSTSNRGIVTAGLEGSLNSNGADGWGRTIGVNLTVQPAANVRLSFGPSFGRFHNVSQFVRGVNDAEATATYGRRSVFATLDQRELALDTRLSWTFSPKMSLQLFVQPLISTGDYTDYKEFTTPGGFDFAVYGQDRGTIARNQETGSFAVDPDGAGPAQGFGIADQNFNFRSLRGNAVFRWEFRPGSTLFLVWQQSRQGVENIGDFSLSRDFGEVFRNPATNVLALKMTYWLGA